MQISAHLDSGTRANFVDKSIMYHFVLPHTVTGKANISGNN